MGSDQHGADAAEQDSARDRDYIRRGHALADQDECLGPAG